MKGRLIILGLLMSAGQLFAQTEKEFIAQQAKIDRLYTLLQKNYTDDINIRKVTEAAIVAALKELDPHSYYLTAAEVQQSNESLQGGFDGIGISYLMESDTLVVTSLVKNGPAEKEGVLPGDKLILIDDSLVAGNESRTKLISKMLRGKKNTSVNVQFLRVDEGLVTFKIKRDKIPVYTVPSFYMVDDKIGYVKVSRFGSETSRDLTNAIKKLKKQGMQKLILDLQDNPGGYLSAAVNMVDEFILKDKLIVYTSGKNSPRKDYMSSNRGEFEAGDLVVLVNENSASASEIVSGAVQDHDRGVVVGRRTYGKGLVQNTYLFSDSSAVRVTTARYFTPSGRCIQKPYDEGNDKYFDNLKKRLDSGELTTADSIKLNSDYAFKTANSRTVYGSGGVMPDVFIPRDSIYKDSLIQKLNTKNILYRYAVKYTNNGRKDLMKTYDFDFSNFYKNFQLDTLNQNSLEAFAKKYEIEFEFDSLKSSEKQYIYTIIKSNIARLLWDNSEYYQCLNENDSVVLSAIEILKNEKVASILLETNK